MGRISKRLLREFQRAESVQEDHEEAETGGLPEQLMEDELSPEELLDDGFDPLHVNYIMAYRLCMLLTHSLSELDEFDEFIDTKLDTDRKYTPDDEELGPITSSFHGHWTYFDLRFGKDKETVGTCLVDVLGGMDADQLLLNTIKNLSDSRLGIYEHRGVRGEYLEFRELVTGKELSCCSTSGYEGKKGELWLARLAPPIPKDVPYHVNLATPYILTQASHEDWTAFLNKSLLQQPGSDKQTLYEFLKFGTYPTSWHDFIVQAYVRSTDQAVFLAGLPDVPSSLPRVGCHNELGKRQPRGDKLAPEKQLLVEMTQAQRRTANELLPGFCDNLQLRKRTSCLVSMTRKSLQQLAQHATEALNDCKGAKRKTLQRLIDLAAEDDLRGTNTEVYRLLIELDEVEPEVWRRIEIQDCDLETLHDAIQLTMGWDNAHLYQFSTGEHDYSPPAPEFAMVHDCLPNDPAETYLSDLVPIGTKNFTFMYCYDFGDDWQHFISVERISPPEDEATYPTCLAGDRACPPEDCGGAFRYVEFLEAIADPDAEWHEEAVEWFGEFDPEHFDIEETTRLLARWIK
jgi:hypothetical protein